MANTYQLISSTVVNSSVTSVTFSAIPSAYTDLVLRASIRSAEASTTTPIRLQFNSDTATNYSVTTLNGDGSAANSFRRTSFTYIDGYQVPAASGTANTYSSTELYIPSYTASQNKSISLMQLEERNSTTAEMNAIAGLWRNTAAITSILIDLGGTKNFAIGSSFYLYGIKNS